MKYSVFDKALILIVIAFDKVPLLDELVPKAKLGQPTVDHELPV